MLRLVPTFLYAFGCIFFVTSAGATNYEVGPGQVSTQIADVPWNTLQPGDQVRIHYRPQPYREKWVIWRTGTPSQPIVITGVLGPGGERPIIDGENATTPAGLNFWNEPRGVIKIGGANPPSGVPDIDVPAHIVIENLEIRNGKPPFTFTNDSGGNETYANNCAGIYIEKAQNLTVRNCVLHGCGNGLFAGSSGGETQGITVEYCHYYGNGIVGEFLYHNNYTEARNITFQFNHFGPLLLGATGNNLKDRSAGLTVRYNWIESGSRTLDLVDGGGYAGLPEYAETYVYGNVLVKDDLHGNNQVVHYGGDGSDTSGYRKGTLFFFNNTIYSTRSGNTTLVRLSTSEETMACANNIYFGVADGSRLALISNTGTVELRDTWIKSGYQISHDGGASGTVIDLGGNLQGSDPNFVDPVSQNFRLLPGSPCLNNAGATFGLSLDFEYLEHQSSAPRPAVGGLDRGAFELPGGTPVDARSLGSLKSAFRPRP